uniref:Uncharacterized protein n=1 Tax=Arundo donax TaxID=35708 RepID=A0A0A9FQK3_ARUDO
MAVPLCRQLNYNYKKHCLPLSYTTLGAIGWYISSCYPLQCSLICVFYIRCCWAPYQYSFIICQRFYGQ